jgi:hypothetical protein
MDQPGVNFVHGVGIDKNGYTRMAKAKDVRHPYGMGLIWSPFSNLLLYGETADIKTAKKAGVTMALGSDWTPTGTKSVLEELKIARAYIQADPLNEGLKATFTDDELYLMVTENPAKLVNHFEDPTKNGHATDGEHGAGTIVIDAAASLVVIAKSHTNPSTNLVEADEQDVNLTIVDGRVVYGNVSYLDRFKVALPTLHLAYDAVEDFSAPLSTLKATDFPSPRGVNDEPDDDAGDDESSSGGGSADDKLKHLSDVVKATDLKALKGDTTICAFTEPKAFVVQASGDQNVAKFKADTGLDLDRVGHIQLLLGVNLLTQSRNVTDAHGNKCVPSYVPPLYTSEDATYTTRLQNFISGEYARDLQNRPANRKGFGAIPANMAKDYGLKYDPTKDY